jgi:hypothetical protein
VIFNLCVSHGAVEPAADAFRALIDVATGLGGSFYLTYHRWASPAQVEAAHPRLREFLAAKRGHDPDEVFRSDWYLDLREGLS